MVDAIDHRVPLSIVTGFLGSGKTTLLRAILSRPDMTRTMVLVNEVADIGIDQKLLTPLSDGTVLLDNGCVCCTVRDDLRKVLEEVSEAADGGRAVERILLETSGLADPRALIATIVGAPFITARIRLNGVLTLVDCLNARQGFESYPEFTNQIVAADRVLLTKREHSDAATVRWVRDVVRSLNSGAPIAGRVDLGSLAAFLSGGGRSTDLLEIGRRPGIRERTATRALRRLDATARAGPFRCEHVAVRTFAIAIDDSCDWTVFATWLSLLVHAHGERVLRVKGILNVSDADRPVAVNTVQHLVYFPEHLPRWPDDERVSVLVFIVRDLAPELIVHSLSAFLRRISPARPTDAAGDACIRWVVRAA